MISLLFGSSLGHFWVKKFRPSKPRGDKAELFLVENKEKVLKTEVFRTFCGGDKRDRTADLLNAIQKVVLALAAPRSPLDPLKTLVPQRFFGFWVS